MSQIFLEIKKLTPSDLESLDLITIEQGKKVPTVGGVLLFGKDRLKFFPDAWIQAGRFSGVNKTHIIDTQEILTYPVFAVDEVIQFVKKHAMKEITIEGAKHTVNWHMPLIAIREAVINAIAHADYAQQDSPIRIAIFDNRIEIDNPGFLLFGLTIPDIKQGISKLRNRVIGQVFFRLGLIERWGSGIDSCLEQGFPEPLFEEIGTHFRVTIYIKRTHVPDLDDVEQRIIDILKSGESLSTGQIATLIHMTQRAMRSRLIKLIKKGRVVEYGTNLNDPKRQYAIKDQR